MKFCLIGMTFHFTINDLAKTISEQLNEKYRCWLQFTTLYTHLKLKVIKEISINSDKSYFDTNVTNHHHFFR